MEEMRVKVKKASKFIDNFIKIITFLSFMLFLATFYISRYKSRDIYQNQVALCDTVWSQGMTDVNPLNNPIHTAFLDNKNNCFMNAKITSEMWGSMSFITFTITLLLPSVYFGSKKVVKETSDKIKKVNTLS